MVSFLVQTVHCKFGFASMHGKFFLWQIDSGLFLISFCPTLLENLVIFQDEKRLRGALWFANGCGALTVRERGAIPALPTKEDVFAAILGSGNTF